MLTRFPRVVIESKKDGMEQLLKLAGKLEQELLEIKQRDIAVLEQAHLSIMRCRDLLGIFKKTILKNGFNSTQEEIEFFKYTKQIPLVQLIYFSEIHSLELQFPKADKEAQLKFIKKKIQKLNRFFWHHADFERYVEAGHTYFDQAYYTRDYLNNYHIMDSEFYFQDPDFFTPKDMLLGKIKAFALLLSYLDHKMISLNNLSPFSLDKSRSNEKLPWPFGDTAFTEFVYALFYAGLQRENLTVIQICRKLQEVFDVDIKNIYKLFQEIKARKKSQTVFLDKLTLALMEAMKQSDAKEFS